MKRLEWKCAACDEEQVKNTPACWLERDIAKRANLNGTRVCYKCYSILTA